jgi:hypothetical protein
LIDVRSVSLDPRREHAVNETPLEASQRELAELYRRLALTRTLSRDRLALHMEISRTKKRIAELQKEAPQAG